ncbi:sensor histidine kinase [Actinotalea sp. K2]|uniref:anti-sigma factor RsbA family regulatory protein n=1 Tax=Actinotalea sp. K2 TaxID=2939438 RepID=UPI0020183B11|nr:sensor histidine kinase [Actinotalea sp. K2]MCL3861336.1 sensor histidine kinase [Actinotalea sp. K2]
MTLADTPLLPSSVGYCHEALLWHGIDSFLASAVPFVTEGLDAGSPVLVAVTAPLADALRTALDPPDGARVEFVDMAELGRNPARIIPAWLDFIARHASSGIPLRCIGEPIWDGRREAEISECQIHEAMLNLVIPAHAPLWLLCPYDTETLGQGVLDEALRSHPTFTDADGSGVSARYAGDDHAHRLSARDLPAPGAPTHDLLFGRGSLGDLRRLVHGRAVDAGIDAARAGDLVLGVNEVAANSLDHGGGRGLLRTWSEPGALVFEVRDAGRVDDLLVGRIPPSPAQPRGRGLWIVNQLCDLMQIRTTEQGTVVRVVTWL